MLERRPMLGLLIGVTLCVSIWRITMQESSMIDTLNGYVGQYQQQQQHHRHHTVEPQISSAIHTTVGTIITNNIQKKETNYNTDSISYSLNNNNNIRGAIISKSNSNSSNSNNNKISRKINDSNLLELNSLASHYNNHYHTISSSQISYLTNFNYDELPKNDFNNLIDLENFKFTINQLPCRRSSSIITAGTVMNSNDNNVNDKNYNQNSYNSDDDDDIKKNYNGPLVLILVHSAPNNYKKRLHIRETWGSIETPIVRLIFLLGAINDNKLQHKIELENNIFSDIVQGNFIDAYQNMTYKHVMALKWFTYYCPDAKFLLKIDDDVFVNTPYLIDYLNRYAKRTNLLFCEILYWSRVKRSYRSKWRVSTKEYPNRYYPPYCPGYSIIYSPDIVYRLYQIAQKSKYFWIDDVHITGTLAQKSNITITSSSSFILTKEKCEKILNYSKFNEYNINNMKNNNNNNNDDDINVNIINNNNNNNYNYNINNNFDNDNNSRNVMNIENFLFLFSWPDIEEEQSKNLWKIIEKLR